MCPLTELSEAERHIALQRFHIIEPYIHQRETLRAIAQTHSLSKSTLGRWVSRYRKQGLSGLVKKQRSDKGTREFPDKLLYGIEALVLHRPHLTTTTIHKIISRVAGELGMCSPSYSFVHQYVADMPKDLKTLAHAGSQGYGDVYELIFTHNASRSNEIWQADHTQLDIIVLDEHGNEKRPWLTIILDDKSRVVAGYYLTVAAPSALNTSLALRQAIWRKQDPDWPVCGIPDTLYTDHGSDFTSRHIEQVCVELKIELVFSSVGKPRGRGKIERFFETINQMLLSELPGYTKSRAIPATLMTMEKLEQQIRTFLLKDYHHRIHPSPNMTPLESWQKGGFLPRLPESYDQLDLLLATVAKSRKVRNIGISFSGLNYQSPALAAYVGEPVVIRYDPRDISEIRVFHADKYLCNAICPALSAHSISLEELIKARKKRKVELHKTIRERKSLVDQILQTPRPLPETKSRPSPTEPATKTSSLKIYENE